MTQIDWKTRAEAAEALLAEAREALERALDGWEDAAQYKGDYLREKHGDLEEIAELRATLSRLKPGEKGGGE